MNHRHPLDNPLYRLPATTDTSFVPETKRPTQPPTPATDTLLKQLLSPPSANHAKQAILKKSMDQVRQNNPLSDTLSERIQHEVDHFFGKPATVTDTVTLSEDSALKAVMDHELQDHDHTGQRQQLQKAFQPKPKKSLSTPNSVWDPLADIPEDTLPTPLPKTPNATPSDATMAKGPTLQTADLKELATLFSQTIFKNPQAQHKLQKKQRELLKKGVRQATLDVAQTKIAQLVQQHVIYDMKQALIRHHMAKGFSTLERLSHSDLPQANQDLQKIARQGQFAGQLSPLSEAVHHQTQQELAHFLFDESVNEFTKHALGQQSLKDFTDMLVKLQHAAKSAGVELSETELTAKICASIDHLGLAQFSPNDSGQNPPKKPQKILTPDEALDDTLRYLYMMKALHPQLRKQIDIHFKMRKTKNGMIKLGIYTEERNTDLKKQGEFLAAKQCRDHLMDAFREEATLVHLSGSEYGVIRKKQAFYLSRLRHLHYGLRPHHIDRIRDAAYRDMYGVIKEDILQLENQLAVRNHIGPARKLAHLKKIIERISKHVTLYDNMDTITQLTASHTPRSIDAGA